MMISTVMSACALNVMACIGSGDTVHSATKMHQVVLRQIWHADGVDASVRVKMANVGIVSVDMFSNLAIDDLAKASEEIIGGESLWGTGPERLVATLSSKLARPFPGVPHLDHTGPEARLWHT